MRATKATAEKNFIKIQKKIINLQIEMILYLKITNEQKFNYMLRFICLILLYLVSLLDNFNYYLKIQKYHHELKRNMLQTQKLPYTYQQSIKNKQFNTSALTVWAEEDYFYLEPNYSKCLIPTVLIIDRKRKKIKQVKSQQFKKPTTASSFYFSFFIGIIDLNGKKIMMLSESVQIVCTISKREIFKITKPIFLFYNPEEKKNLTDQQAKILINLVTIYQSGMYFSYAYNLTQPLHHIKRIDIYKVNSYFNWAQPFQNQLVNCNSMWSLPVIQGFVNKIQLYTNAQKLRIILISRRSLKQGGPWQYNCGLTQKGHSANYVQTQQILAVNHLLFSFLQIRGSAPIMWSQKFSYGVPTGVSLQKSIQQNYKAFKLHISNMLVNRSYQNIILFNLLSKQSSSQKKLIQNFEYLIKTTEKEKVLGVQGRNVNNNKKTVGIHYAYFDFHARCPSKNYKQLNKFINEELQSILLSCGFTAIGVKQSDNKIYQILNVQKGVIRTNCGTCIDRTNITQCRLAAYQLVYILNQLNVKLSFFNKNLQFIDDESSFGTLYRNLWADNADNLSKQYTGTGSINSVAVRKGSLSYMTTIDHGMKSLVRALRNVRQEDEQKNKTVVFMMRRFRQFTNKIVQNPIQKQNLIDLDQKPIEQKQQKLDNNIEELPTKQDIPKTKQTEPQSLI